MAAMRRRLSCGLSCRDREDALSNTERAWRAGRPTADPVDAIGQRRTDSRQRPAMLVP
jgi:hypothetical protein